MTRTYDGFTAAERSAMKERAKELKNGAKETEVLAKIAEMSGSDREVGERLHDLIRSAAPGLTPKLWYGMPAYARDGKVVCFFQPAAKFKSRYAMLGFSDEAHLDDGEMWPTYFAITEFSADVASRISALVSRAA
ncbi:iron chaperone [Actinoplanes subglobosus]|uniref:Iron chaperone n=1 Tax=Actinoplanes subglobosus TaxID=1547892 RepID=A0ABV8ING5_9ACTN